MDIYKDIYQEFIMEHARNPRNVGEIKGVKKIVAKNPFCGDEAEIYLSIKDGKIIYDVKYKIQGCILSRAALSIFSENIKGKTASEVKKIKEEDIFKLVGATPSPSRQNCVLFSALDIINNI